MSAEPLSKYRRRLRPHRSATSETFLGINCRNNNRRFHAGCLSDRPHSGVWSKALQRWRSEKVPLSIESHLLNWRDNSDRSLPPPATELLSVFSSSPSFSFTRVSYLYLRRTRTHAHFQSAVAGAELKEVADGSSLGTVCVCVCARARSVRVGVHLCVRVYAQQCHWAV